MRDAASTDSRIFASVGRGVYRLPYRLANGSWGLVGVDRTGQAIAEREYTTRDEHGAALRDLQAILDERDAVPPLRVIE